MRKLEKTQFNSCFGLNYVHIHAMNLLLFLFEFFVISLGFYCGQEKAKKWTDSIKIEQSYINHSKWKREIIAIYNHEYFTVSMI